jgi:6-methylsalicylate decarboxylase
MNHICKHGLSRRNLLRAFAGVGAGAMLHAPGIRAESLEQGGTARRGRIDVHHHMMPAFHFPKSQWSPETSLAVMDKYSTELAILSFVTPGAVIYDGSEKARAMARQANEFGAKAVSDHPKRFGFFAALPLRESDASLKEIEYAFDTLKCDGVVVMTNSGDKWPGDPLFAPVFDELNRRKSAVFLHPSVANCCRNIMPGIGEGVIEYDFDTTRAVTSLLFSGTLARCQDIRWIVNHSGACIPVMAGRIKDRVPGAESSRGRGATDGKSDKTPNGVYYELKRLYYECAHASYPMPIAALRAFAPPTQYLFGTDFPVEPYETTVEQIPGLNLPSDVQYAMDRGNAERLWPKFK